MIIFLSVKGVAKAVEGNYVDRETQVTYFVIVKQKYIPI